MIAELSIPLIDKPIWQASSTTLIVMSIIILIIDGDACERIKVYKKENKFN